jgi:hypothetical protein
MSATRNSFQSIFRGKRPHEWPAKQVLPTKWQVSSARVVRRTSVGEGLDMRSGLRDGRQGDNHTKILDHAVRLLAPGLLVLAWPATSQACTADSECKGDRICEQGVCIFKQTTTAPPARATAARHSSAPVQTETPTLVPLVVIEPSIPVPVDAGLAESPPVVSAAAPTSTPPGNGHVELAASAAPTVHAEPRRGEGEYIPALGFRCLLVGESACALQVRPLAFDWSHVDLHGDLFLGGFEGGDFGIGVGSRYLRLGGASSDLGLVFRWDFDLMVIRSTAIVSDPLLEVGLESGPKFGLSYLLNKDVALEGTINGGLLVGYGFALNAGGASQVVVDGYFGLLLGARF